MDDMEKDSSSVSETSSKSPEIRAFFDLVDRAYSLQLLNEKNNQGSEKPLRNNFSVWKPSFEPEDFNLPPKSGSTSTVDPPITMAAEADKGKDEENRLKRGLKRPRQFLELTPHFVSEEELKKGDTSKVFLCDLNKEAEPSEGINGGSGLTLNLELGIVRK